MIILFKSGNLGVFAKKDFPLPVYSPWGLTGILKLICEALNCVSIFQKCDPLLPDSPTNALPPSIRLTHNDKSEN